MGLTQGAGAHPTAGTYLPHFQWLRAPSVKNCLARVKLQEITPYVLSCSCAKRDGGSFHFQKSSETRSLEIFLDSCERNLGRRYSACLSLLFLLQIHPGSAPGWTGHHGGFVTHVEELGQALHRDDTSGHLLWVTNRGLFHVLIPISS